MLAAASNVKPAGVSSGGAVKELRGELLGDPELGLFPVAASLAGLVVSPDVNRTLGLDGCCRWVVSS